MADVDYEKIRKFLNQNDHFCVENGMVLTVVREGYAEAEVEIKDWMMNGLNVVQGGVLFTLCDFAFAGAANSYGKPCIAMCGNISFMRPGLGTKLKAVAQMVNCGRTTCVCDVTIHNDAGKIVVKTTLTGYFIEKKS